MARKPAGETVAIACALLTFVVLFTAFLVVSCRPDEGPPVVRTSPAGAPTPTTTQSSDAPPPYTFNLTPVPLAPESTVLPAPPKTRR